MVEKKSTFNGVTHSTTVSIALVVAMVAGAYWAGANFSGLTSRVDNMSSVQTTHEKLIDKLSDLAADNKRRLDLQQQIVERKEGMN